MRGRPNLQRSMLVIVVPGNPFSGPSAVADQGGGRCVPNAAGTGVRPHACLCGAARSCPPNGCCRRRSRYRVRSHINEIGPVTTTVRCLTAQEHRSIVVHMVPEFNEGGLLPPGVHWTDWDELMDRFGFSPKRQCLMKGLRAALENLRNAGCRVVYIDGSFVTCKVNPNDYDVCWEEDGVKPVALDPVLLHSVGSGKKDRRKAKYCGDLFPAANPATQDGQSFVNYFQIDKKTGNPKGILAMDLTLLA